MSSVDDGCHVFPTFNKCGEVAISEGGLSLRDYFAGQAMTGMITNSDAWGFPHPSGKKAIDANVAYQFADAMLAARKGVKP